jgi:hypothetical protein
MELSTTREATSCKATRWFPNILWNPKVHYRIYKISTPVPILSQTVHSTPPHSISTKSILILSIHLRFGLPSGRLLSRSPTNSLYSFLFSPSCYMTHPSHLFLLDRSKYTWRRKKITKLLVMQFFQPLYPSSLFSLNILFNTLFSNTHSPCFHLNVTEQDSHPYRTRGNIIILYILIFMFFDSR